MLLVIACGLYGVLCFYAFRAVRYLCKKGWDCSPERIPPNESLKESFVQGIIRAGCAIAPYFICQALLVVWLLVARIPPGIIGRTGQILCVYLACVGLVSALACLSWYMLKGVIWMVWNVACEIGSGIRDLRNRLSHT